MDILPATPPPDRGVVSEPTFGWRRPAAIVGLAGLSVPGFHLGGAALALFDDDPGFFFAVMPFVIMGMLAASGIILATVLGAMLTLVLGGRPVRVFALLTAIAAIPIGVMMVPFGGVLGAEGVLVVASGALVVLALATPGAGREVGPLLGLKHPREYVRPGVTPWWELWREGIRAGLPLIEWVAIAVMVVATIASQILLVTDRRLAAGGALLGAMALAVYVERGMRTRRASRSPRQ